VAGAIETRRLTQDDTTLATQLFALMAEVFDEGPRAELRAAYVDGLLRRPDFWAIAAFVDGELAGGLTAHTLPMTRSESFEIFIYDLAVRADRQRRGVGRRLVGALREMAAAEGIDDVFVPADDEDAHALAFYRALGADGAPVTIFVFPPNTGD
jgi:aminoglycoside 3-N-acetyltransferase I